MKKFLPVLVLSTLFAALLVPTTASIALAAECPSNQIITATCTCGAGNTLTPGGGNYCDNGTMRTGSPTGTGGGTRESAPKVAPTVVTTAGGLIGLIENIGNWVFVALLSIAGIFLVVAGLMWVTAGGNPEKANKARQMLINALIGVAIALLARGMVMVITSVMGG